MAKFYVIDTNGIIGYFCHIFEVPERLSKKTCGIIDQAFKLYETEIKISIPSVVFVEIFEKWFWNESFAKKFYYEIFTPTKESPNIEIKPIDQEIMERLMEIKGNLENHDLHDKIVLASAMMLGCPLITTDTAITDYVKVNKVIPYIIK